MRNVFLGAIIALVGGYLFRLMEARSRLTNSIRLLITELDAILDNLEKKGLKELQPQLERSMLDYRALIRDLDPIKFEEHRKLHRELYEAVSIRKLDLKGTLNILIRARYHLRAASQRLGDPELGPPPIRENPPDAFHE